MRKWERGHDTGGKREAGLIRLTGPTVLRSDLREDVKKHRYFTVRLEAILHFIYSLRIKLSSR